MNVVIVFLELKLTAAATSGATGGNNINYNILLEHSPLNIHQIQTHRSPARLFNKSTRTVHRVVTAQLERAGMIKRVEIRREIGTTPAQFPRFRRRTGELFDLTIEALALLLLVRG